MIEPTAQDLPALPAMLIGNVLVDAISRPRFEALAPP